MAVSNDVILERLDGIEKAITNGGRQIDALSKRIDRQNGRIGTIELARAEEKGARDAVAKAAADTAAALTLREKSFAWKARWSGIIIGSVATLCTLGALIAQLVVGHG